MNNKTRDARMCIAKISFPELMTALGGESKDKTGFFAKDKENEGNLMIPSVALTLSHMGNGSVDYHPLNHVMVVLPSEASVEELLSAVESLLILANDIVDEISGAFDGCNEKCLYDESECDMGRNIFRDISPEMRDIVQALYEKGACIGEVADCLSDMVYGEE